MERIADGICDKELGGLCFFDKTSHKPVYVIGNYAAHPLAGHCPGIGGHRISADYPGAFREYIEAEVGAGCMFISGAAGDMVPRGHETGVAAIRRVGQALAQAAIDSMVLARRDANSFKLKNESLQCGIRKVTVKVRPGHALQPDYTGRSTVDLEMQLVSLGICLVGRVNCWLNWTEIKWHSPFRENLYSLLPDRILQLSVPRNALVSGGYEETRRWKADRTETGMPLSRSGAAVRALTSRILILPSLNWYVENTMSEPICGQVGVGQMVACSGLELQQCVAPEVRQHKLCASFDLSGRVPGKMQHGFAGGQSAQGQSMYGRIGGIAE